jgi:HEAT repeat protein
MRHWASLASLLVVCLSLHLAAPRSGAAEADEVAADRAALKEAGVAADGSGLLAFFKKRTLTDEESARIRGLIEKLGADDFDERVRAQALLIESGPVARRLLREALKSKDTEVRRRTRWCLAGISKDSADHVLGAAVRMLAQQRPGGALETLLNYLPSADDPDVVEEVVRGLASAGVREGKADEVLVKALKDRLPAKRAAAGGALARAGGEKYRAAVHKLLKDKDVAVRQGVALALLEARDKQALPVLIALLTEGAGDDREMIEDRLAQVAGDKGPAPPAGGSAEARRKHRAAWEKWWKDHGGTLDLAKVEFTPALKGYTVVAMLSLGAARKAHMLAGKVVELDAEGKVRWEIEGLAYPTFARVVRHDRVLIVEYTAGRVSERTFKGEIKWQKDVGSQPLGAQRLRNGNTFVYTRNLLLELDRTGKEVRRLTRPFDVIAAHRRPDGQVWVLSSHGKFIRLDRTGKELSSFAVTGMTMTMGTNMHVLRNGHVVVPHYRLSKVVEYDRDGKEVWSASVARPGSVRRLPNGQTLVTSRLTRRIVLLDKAGKEVWSKNMDGYVYYADRR